MADRLKIFKLEFPAEFVVFDHNPEKLQVKRKLAGGSPSKGAGADDNPASGGLAGTLGAMYHGSDPMELTITKARLVGVECKPMCDSLMGWLAPNSGLLGAVGGLLGVSPSAPPTLVVQWGPPSVGFTMTATLVKATVTYVRMTPAGIPVHALVNLTLKEAASLLNLTNPTSGGRPGRDRHVVCVDDTLMSIATKAFGDPNAWRAIAEVNGIDNPTSIRPGDSIYLPGRDELRELAGARR